MSATRVLSSGAGTDPARHFDAVVEHVRAYRMTDDVLGLETFHGRWTRAPTRSVRLRDNGVESKERPVVASPHNLSGVRVPPFDPAAAERDLIAASVFGSGRKAIEGTVLNARAGSGHLFRRRAAIGGPDRPRRDDVAEVPCLSRQARASRWDTSTALSAPSWSLAGPNAYSVAGFLSPASPLGTGT
jgi:hypothetical protein